jgi:hypothetical protein
VTHSPGDDYQQHVIHGPIGKKLNAAKKLAKREKALERRRATVKLKVDEFEALKQRSSSFFCDKAGCRRVFQTHHFLQLHQASDKCPDAGTQVCIHAGLCLG